LQSQIKWCEKNYPKETIPESLDDALFDDVLFDDVLHRKKAIAPLYAAIAQPFSET
jgi:hypothetical protein